MADFDLTNIFADVGVSATYVPQDTQIEPFTLLVVPTGGVALNTFQPFGYSDTNAVFVQNADILKAGLESPTVRDSGLSGDSIIRQGPHGTEEAWIVTEKEYYDYADVWVLTLEKDIRFRP